MANYEVKVEVQYSNGMLVEETYEVFAYDLDEAADKVRKGQGTLTDEEILEYTDVVGEKVVEVRRVI